MTEDKIIPLISKEKIAHRVDELADEIVASVNERPMVIVGLLTGAVVFVADLMRVLSSRGVDVEVDFMIVKSYGAKETSSGKPKVILDLSVDIAGKTVIIVDDISDSGFTLTEVTSLIKRRDPAKVLTCVLLNKPVRRKTDFCADFVGFVIEDKFVVGYGLDKAEKFRGLPYIGYLEGE